MKLNRLVYETFHFPIKDAFPALVLFFYRISVLPCAALCNLNGVLYQLYLLLFGNQFSKRNEIAQNRITLLFNLIRHRNGFNAVNLPHRNRSVVGRF